MDLMRQKRFRPEDAAEEVHEIHGTGITFSSTPCDLDYKAVEKLRKICHEGLVDVYQYHDGVVVLKTDHDGVGVLKTDPQNLPEGLFLSSGHSFWEYTINTHKPKGEGWNCACGYGIKGHDSLYDGFKKTYVYHKGNQKTKWIMNVYHLIDGNINILAANVVLCHVFQSDNYDPEPKPRPQHVPNFFDFDKSQVDSCVQRLEALILNPHIFEDLDDFNGTYNKYDSKWKAKNGKRAKIWEHFTEIKVLGADGEVMITLAICHGCNMAYQTGRWDSEKRRLTNNGTKTLTQHKCSGQHRLSGNPQVEHHQML